MSDTVRLHPEDREAIAVHAAQLVLEAIRCDRDFDQQHERPHRDEGFPATPADIARRHSVSADWVRANATALGGVRLGTGPKARHRFNPETADARIAAMRAPAGEPRVLQREPEPRRARRRASKATTVPLLPIKGANPQ